MCESLVLQTRIRMGSISFRLLRGSPAKKLNSRSGFSPEALVVQNRVRSLSVVRSDLQLPRLAVTASISLTPDQVEEISPKIQQVADWVGQVQAVDLQTIQPAIREELESNIKNNEVEGFSAPDTNPFGHSFRNYDKESERSGGVEAFYKTNHINQTYEFATNKKEEHGKLNKGKMSIWDCCEFLNEYVDESDPDLDEPQIEHLLQSAEAIRRDYPNEDWLHLTALIHDLGKVLLHPKFGAEPQWCVVGDTYPLGCAFDESIVYHKYFEQNPDINHPVYSMKLGIYKENCGLKNVTMSWGHDEYMYMVMKGNNTTLPDPALFIVRFHSFYPLHRNGAYYYLMSEEDEENLKWLRIFNKYDLYSKSKVRVDVEKVKPYYLSLIEKYFPAKLKW
ncbi:Inositol oxygenase [Actinidia chinensis var. chinensis]|uniref:Inositol oxygenase n=1 Tax=Actinidia chinensis var. chinensis TaxID=1590841 RepID=A0A2R6PIR3_ACTCC|nr:Inositol oxygenase [Actinidia chinensis var. chinensis]